jgi:hypothetical protein
MVSTLCLKISALQPLVTRLSIKMKKSKEELDLFLCLKNDGIQGPILKKHPDL